MKPRTVSSFDKTVEPLSLIEVKSPFPSAAFFPFFHCTVLYSTVNNLSSREWSGACGVRSAKEKRGSKNGGQRKVFGKSIMMLMRVRAHHLASIDLLY
jgi:hypothetical protein